MTTFHDLIHKQKEFFASDRTQDVSFRITQLKILRDLIVSNEKSLMAALKQDLRKSAFEAYTTEIGVTLAEITFMLKHLRIWAKPRKVRTPLTHFGAKSYIYREPYGVVLILSPWNYPFYLCMAPLIGAIAAGNCAVLKPSELTPATSSLMAELIEEYFSSAYISVVEGDVVTSKALLEEQWDYIFFTGSTAVGKVIMEAAAKHLTPVTLELGGKSPCIVHRDAKLDLAAKRIVWGKFLNAGQTCIAPDYLFVHKDIKTTLVQYIKHYIQKLYGANPLLNEQYAAIVNERHFDRLCNLLGNGDILIGGKNERQSRTIEPTVLHNVGWDDPVMREEIFGPIMPILDYESLSEVVAQINHRPKPLALYVFTEDRSVQEQVLQSVSFGGGSINDTVYHIASPHLPFGGVGASGIGAYHGKASFDTFTHQKSVLKQTTLFDLPFRYSNIKNGLKKVKLFLK